MQDSVECKIRVFVAVWIASIGLGFALVFVGAVFMSVDTRCPANTSRLSPTRCSYDNNTIVPSEHTTVYYDRYMPMTVAGGVLLIILIVIMCVAAQRNRGCSQIII